jgi:hypothetical protein
MRPTGIVCVCVCVCVCLCARARVRGGVMSSVETEALYLDVDLLFSVNSLLSHNCNAGLRMQPLP